MFTPKLNDDFPAKQLDRYPSPTEKLRWSHRQMKEELLRQSRSRRDDFLPIPGSRPGLEKNSRGEYRYLSPVAKEPKAYKAPIPDPELIPAAAQEPTGTVLTPRVSPPGERVESPAAAAPIQGEIRVGDVVLWHGHVVTIESILAKYYIGRFHGEHAQHHQNGRGTFGLSELKLLGRPGPDGWIPHTPGDPCPVPEGTAVNIMCRVGPGRSVYETQAVAARYLTWNYTGDATITHWRLAEEI